MAYLLRRMGGAPREALPCDRRHCPRMLPAGGELREYGHPGKHCNFPRFVHDNYPDPLSSDTYVELPADRAAYKFKEHCYLPDRSLHWPLH